MTPKQQYGFTLIEMLTTVGIVAVLAVLLTTTIRFSIDFATDAKALATMRQLMNFAYLTQADNQGRIAYRKKLPAPLGRLYWFQYFVIEYGNYDPDSIRSPLDNTWEARLSMRRPPSYPLPPTENYTAFSHAMNLNLTPRRTEPDIAGSPSTLHFWNLTASENLSKTALFFEGMGTQGGVSSGSDLEKFLRFSGRGRSHVNVGYLDGHVGRVAKTDLLEPAQSSWSPEERNIFWTSHNQ